MPVPYSDNLYSADFDASDDEDAYPSLSADQVQHSSTFEQQVEDDDALSPTDGYFHSSQQRSFEAHTHQDGLVDLGTGDRSGAASDPTALHQERTSSQVPSIPNILVEDPTVRTRNDKAREAEEERRLNSSSVENSPFATAASPYPETTSTSTTSPPPPPPSSSSHPTPSHQDHTTSSANHHYRRSVEENEPLDLSSESRSSHTSYQYPVPTPSSSTLSRNGLPSRHSEAPPAYTPSPTSPIQSASIGYNTFSPFTPTPITALSGMGSPAETQRLLPSREPQSMGDSSGGSRQTRWQKFKGYFSSPDIRKKIKSLLGVLVLLSVLSILISGISHMDIVGPQPGRDQPRKGAKKPTDWLPDFTWSPASSCHNQKFNRATIAERIPINGNQPLTISQVISGNPGFRDGRNPNVWGEIYLRKTSPGDKDGQIDVQIISNTKDIPIGTEFTDTTYRIITPRAVHWSESNGSPCIQIRITVSLPEGANFEYLAAESVQLDIIVMDDFRIGADDGISLSSSSGDVVLPGHKGDNYNPYTLQSRKIAIHTVSGDVLGLYPLYDALFIETSSGDVHIDVEPKAVDEEAPQPARLEVTTVSGDIDIREPIDRPSGSKTPGSAFPPRDYLVDIRSSSGHIRGDFAISSSAKFSAISGDSNIRLLPILDTRLQESHETVALLTQSSSGDQHVNVLAPVWTSIVSVHAPANAPRREKPPVVEPIGSDDPYLIIHPPDAPTAASTDAAASTLSAEESQRLSNDTPTLSCLSSKHESVSGNMYLKYPSVWEGTIHATAISGSQNVRGQGLLVTKKGRFPKELIAKKGKGSLTTIGSSSGDQDVTVGEP